MMQYKSFQVIGTIKKVLQQDEDAGNFLFPPPLNSVKQKKKYLNLKMEPL